MPVAYLLLLVIAFVFGRIHWPGASLIILLSIGVMLVDLLIQFIRIMIGKIHVSTLLGSIALMILSVGYAYKWLFWPGAFFTSVFALVAGAAYLVYFVLSKRKPTARFVITTLTFVVLLSFAFMKESTLFCMKNDIDPKTLDAPVFSRHHLAWLYHREGNDGAAMSVLMNERAYIVKKLERLESDSHNEMYISIFQEDQRIVEEAIADLSAGRWNHYEPLFPEDFR